MKTTHLNVPNTTENTVKAKQAVAQFMVEEILTKDQITELAMDYLELVYDNAGHTIGDLAKLVKNTDVPSQVNRDGTTGPSQPNRMLCSGTIPGYKGKGADRYFFTKEQDYENSAMEVKEEVQ